jgi:hypothetical protein
LEQAISEAVRQSASSCKDFVGVIIKHARPKTRSAPNWAIRGIRFGRSDRQKAGQAIAAIVSRMQSEFKLSQQKQTVACK